MENVRKMGVLSTALCALAVLLTSGTASAGLKYTAPVYVDAANRYANGGLGYARNTSNGVEYIGCSISQYSGSASMFCSARNAAGSSVSCYSTDAAFIDAARTLGIDEYLSFSANTSGYCTNLYVEHYSYNQPKVL